MDDNEKYKDYLCLNIGSRYANALFIFANVFVLPALFAFFVWAFINWNNSIDEMLFLVEMFLVLIFMFFFVLMFMDYNNTKVCLSKSNIILRAPAKKDVIVNWSDIVDCGNVGTASGPFFGQLVYLYFTRTNISKAKVLNRCNGDMLFIKKVIYAEINKNNIKELEGHVPEDVYLKLVYECV